MARTGWYQAMKALVGPERARETLARITHYEWIYERVLNDPRVREVSARNGFGRAGGRAWALTGRIAETASRSSSCLPRWAAGSGHPETLPPRIRSACTSAVWKPFESDHEPPTAGVLLAASASGAAAQSLDLGINDIGLSIGNAERWTGVRINWRDAGVREVRGINLTLWKPHENANPDFVMNGIAIGVFGPWASELNGIAVGLGGVIADDKLNGIGLGGLAVISGGQVTGLSFAGLAAVAEGGMRGAQIAGLATVAEGEIAGISLAGLALVSEGGMRGLNFGGLAVVSEGEMRGLNVGGLAVVSEGGMRGLNLSVLATVSEGDVGFVNGGGLALVGGRDLYGLSLGGLAVVAGGAIRGITVGGAAVVADGGPIEGATFSAGAVDSADRIRGLALGGYRVRTPDIGGLSLSVAMNRTTDLTGGAVGVYNEVRGVQRGVSIGIFNTAQVLRGVQIGLLNHAANNSPPFRWLPLINASF